MVYTVTDIKELIQYHLVASATDSEVANKNLAHLVFEIQSFATEPLWREVSWVFCDRCGTSVDSELIHPEGHRYSPAGSFYCSDCWDAGP